jgi:ElaB/YqjD/DUF883 family membrane-anchored ribosome-binding protein
MMTSIRKYVGWVIGVALFVWGTISAFSIFEKLKFLVDGWSYSVGHFPMPTSAREVLLLIGKWVSVKVANYRDFVHSVVATLGLPHLPQTVYEAAGIFIFSVRRGYQVGKRQADADRQHLVDFHSKNLEKLSELANRPGLGLDERLQKMKEQQRSAFRGEKPFVSKWSRLYGDMLRDFAAERPWAWVGIRVISLVLVYGTAVTLVIAALFGIDYLYRQFA